MKQALSIGLLLLTLGCGQDRVETAESHIHGNVIKVFSVASDTRLNGIWTLTAQCMERLGYVQSVPAPPDVVLVQGQIDCGGVPAVGCTENATTVWLTTDDVVFDRGVGIIAHEFIHVILHHIGITGGNHPAFRCAPVVEEEYNFSHFSFAGGNELPDVRRPFSQPRSATLPADGFLR